MMMKSKNNMKMNKIENTEVKLVRVKSNIVVIIAIVTPRSGVILHSFH